MVIACESSKGGCIKHDMSLSDLEEWDLYCRAYPDAVRARANQQAVEAMTQGKPELVSRCPLLQGRVASGSFQGVHANTFGILSSIWWA